MRAIARPRSPTLVDARRSDARSPRSRRARYRMRGGVLGFGDRQHERVPQGRRRGRDQGARAARSSSACAFQSFCVNTSKSTTRQIGLSAASIAQYAANSPLPHGSASARRPSVSGISIGLRCRSRRRHRDRRRAHRRPRRAARASRVRHGDARQLRRRTSASSDPRQCATVHRAIGGRPTWITIAASRSLSRRRCARPRASRETGRRRRGDRTRASSSVPRDRRSRASRRDRQLRGLSCERPHAHVDLVRAEALAVAE